MVTIELRLHLPADLTQRKGVNVNKASWQFRLVDHGAFVAVHEFYVGPKGELLIFQCEPVSLRSEFPGELISHMGTIIAEINRFSILNIDEVLKTKCLSKRPGALPLQSTPAPQPKLKRRAPVKRSKRKK